MTDATEELLCPRCRGPMPSPISIYTIRSDQTPVSEYVCRHCHRKWLQQFREKRREEAHMARRK